MADLSSFPVTRRWPAQHPDRLQLYSLPTPNGQKIGVALEETGLPYEAHLVSFSTDDQFTPEFLSVNPNNKIPAILDPDGPGGRPFTLFESGAILLYIARKTDQLMPSDPEGRWKAIQWLMFQMGGVGPMFGQLGHFHKFAAEKVTDPYPRQRYLDETKRLLGVLEAQLAHHPYLAGDTYSVADIATFPWINTLIGFYEAADLVEFETRPAVQDWFERCMDRPAVHRGMNIPARS
ncbi:glutathione binding-like protein [Oceanicella sp. SM1341]|uniref:glutathione binding-like protein n=1 Tax=Oceanicella sp. SM1341 TaxID=1548889 RepID=UPI000E543145|nr:glutathione binding-like protein [Oceanicella sp. SM1341]